MPDDSPETFGVPAMNSAPHSKIAPSDPNPEGPALTKRGPKPSMHLQTRSPRLHHGDEPQTTIMHPPQPAQTQPVVMHKHHSSPGTPGSASSSRTLTLSPRPVLAHPRAVRQGWGPLKRLGGFMGMLALVAMPDGVLAQPALSIAPAVEVSWQSLPNKIYQVQGSENPAADAWSEAGAPVLGTGAEVRKMLLRGDARHRVFRLLELPSSVTNWLSGLTELDFRPARLTPQAGGLMAEGIRANAVGITTDDFVTGQFQFDLESQSLRLVHYEVIPSVGVYADRFFAKNVPRQVVGSVGGVPLPDNEAVTLFGTNIVVRLALQLGQVFNFGLQGNSHECLIEWLSPSGELGWSTINGVNTSIISDPIPILRTGVYQLRIRPRSKDAGVSMNCQFILANNNAADLLSITNQSRISATLRQSTYDYVKYSIQMTRGQVARLPGAANVGFQVLNSKSQSVGSMKGLPLIFQAPEDGIYYLFLYSIAANSRAVGYGGTLTIEN